MDKDALRDYRAGVRSSVQPLYRENHERQTLDFVRAKKKQFLTLDRARLGVWEAMSWLDEFVDASDPDTTDAQTAHLFQTAESLRRAEQPRWVVLAGLVHDLGKILCHFGEPQWAVVGDTYPVGCRFSDRIVYAELFANNPDTRVPEYQTPLGIYEPGCGLSAVEMSWGHDEYLYHVLKDRLPEDALYAIRYHSFYAAHHEGAYDHLLDETDRRRMALLRDFSGHDLYSKQEEPPPVRQLRERYADLVEEFLPGDLRW